MFDTKTINTWRNLYVLQNLAKLTELSYYVYICTEYVFFSFHLNEKRSFVSIVLQTTLKWKWKWSPLEVSDSVQPHRWQPTRLHRPWDSPGKNTGVGCHFRPQCMKVKSDSEVAQSCPTLHDPMDCSLPGSSVHGIFQARVLEWVAI